MQEAGLTHDMPFLASWATEQIVYPLSLLEPISVENDLLTNTPNFDKAVHKTKWPEPYLFWRSFTS